MPAMRSCWGRCIAGGAAAIVILLLHILSLRPPVSQALGDVSPRSFVQLAPPVMSKEGERQSPGLISTAAPGVAQLCVQFRVSEGGWAETFHFTDGEMGTYKKMNLS